MASRMMLSPMIESPANVWRSKAESYCDLGSVSYVPSLVTGVPATSFALTLGRAANWTAASADVQIEFLFPVPANIDTPAELRNFLATHTVADLTVPQKTAMQAIFDAHGIPRADFTNATTGTQVMKRVVAYLFERDFNFGMGFQF